jgi:hypothetical protein
VRVDGDVLISVYGGDTTPADGEAKPIHDYEFLGEAWTIHLVDSALGPAYNVFVPYPDKHSWQVKCGLRVRLTPEAGPAVYSETVQVTLPGPLPKPDEATGSANLANWESVKQPLPPAELGVQIKRRKITPADGSLNVARTASMQLGMENDSTLEGNLSRMERLLAAGMVQSPERAAGEGDAAADGPRRFRLEPASLKDDNTE